MIFNLFSLFFQWNLYCNVFDRNVMIKEMLEEIRLENYRAEKQATIEEEEANKRKIQLENTWSLIQENEKKSMDDALNSQEDDEVNYKLQLKIY